VAPAPADGDGAHRELALQLLVRGNAVLAPAARHHLALLGGTTTPADCLVALGYLARPGQLIRGPAIREYEQAFAKRIGVRYAYSFSAGRVGLYGLLGALRVGAGDEVLLQVPTNVTVPNAIRFAGARPVYVDCELESYNIDLEQAERQITPRTKVLLLQHTFGIPVNLEAALALARRHGLDVIEDCVHSLGATYQGKPVGSFGRAAFFSTEETKTISSTMGGMAVTDDAELAHRLEAFQARCAGPPSGLTARYVLKLVVYHVLTQPSIHGYMRRIYESLGERQPLPRPTSAAEQQGQRPAGYERRLSNAQAALALRQLRRLDSNLKHRREVANEIESWLSTRGFHTPAVPKGAVSAFVRYPLWVKDRPAGLEATRRQLVLGTWFTSVMGDSVAAGRSDYESGSCPRAELAAQHLVNLPTHLRVDVADVDGIASRLAERAGIRRKGEPLASAEGILHSPPAAVTGAATQPQIA
jgi:dTDP-4-amino-4,6-dideoxygalactose transaminase